MPEAKDIISPAEAAAVAAFTEFETASKPAAADDGPKLVKRVYRFVKTQVAAEGVPLADGQVIQFRIPRTQYNGFSPVGDFATEDEAVAKQLRDVAKEYFVFPVE